MLMNCGQKGPTLNSSPVYCLRLYSMYMKTQCVLNSVSACLVGKTSTETGNQECSCQSFSSLSVENSKCTGAYTHVICYKSSPYWLKVTETANQCAR